MNATELITKQDLSDFKQELIAEIRALMELKQPVAKKWLRSCEVRKMLSISPGTLQSLRVNGLLEFNKIGGILYYRQEDIDKLMGSSNSGRNIARVGKGG
ncbi:DNA-binding protein [Pedobacter sp. HMF7647]|uniref:DNA-binding protein n=1 Tax=Hufsiella arboris TaxID=2695275 RepID=A0A7K1Y8A0_9SPHI|nr:helix-turn-helix domain-containing protein [Hufsiella arboris]MXV50278.1 DNA-binding protein [Hufsiella arboris]